jgi:hypothetical protein
MLANKEVSQRASLAAMGREKLKAEYKRLFGLKPPAGMQVAQLRTSIEKKMTEGQTTINGERKKIEEVGGRIKYFLKPGEMIVRPYKRKDWKIRGLPDWKFECEGVIYESVTAIAVAITGRNRISGPDFFGFVGENKGRFIRKME